MADPVDEQGGDTDELAKDAPAEDAPAEPKKKKKKARPEITAEERAPAPQPPPIEPSKALPPRAAYLLAIASGFLYFLAFPGVDIWPLSFVALVPMIVAMRGQTPRRALFVGWLAGFTMTMTGFYWLLEMLKVFSGFPTALCIVFMAILCGYQAGRIALCGWLHGRAEQRGWPAAPVFALAFVASELVFPLLFPWYYGATVHNAVVFVQVADLGGPYLVALVLVAVNLGIAEIILARREGRARDRNVLIAAVAAPALGLLYGYPRLRSIDATAAASEPIKFGLVQGNQPLMRKPKAMPLHFRRTAELKQKGVDLVIWSEGATGMANWESPEYDEVRRTITHRLGVPTIIGTVMARQTPGEKRASYFNVALLADEKGAIVGRYDKQYLLAFGEYLPLGDRFPVLYSMSPNSSHFRSGTSLEPLKLGDHRLGTMICYEDILPSFVAGMVRHADPDLLVNITNDAWFGDSTEPWIHLALAKMRAVEHRRYLIRATNSGVSALIDPVGRVPMHGSTFKEESLIGVAKFMKSRTLYGMIGDAPWWLATAAITAMAFIKRKRQS